MDMTRWKEKLVSVYGAIKDYEIEICTLKVKICGMLLFRMESICRFHRSDGINVVGTDVKTSVLLYSVLI